MDAREIVHRVVEGATKQLSRRLTQGWDAIKPDRSARFVSRHCRAPAQLSARSRRNDRPRSGGCHDRANSICLAPNGRHREPCPLLQPIGMSIPMTARCFRSGMPIASMCRSATASTRERSSASGNSPASSSWFHWPPMRAHWRSGRIRAGRRLVRSWMDGNHPFRGLNWSSGIELAFASFPWRWRSP